VLANIGAELHDASIRNNRGGNIVVSGRLNLDNVDTDDADGDNISDEVEARGPAGGDGNGDGIPDQEQENVALLCTPDGQSVTVASPDGTRLSGMHAIGNPSPGDVPSDAEFPLGFYGFEVTENEPGGGATVQVFLPEGIDYSSYWKYSPTPHNGTPHWYEFLFDGETGTEIDGYLIVLHLVDGKRGDHDLTADGIIVDPGSPAVLTRTDLPWVPMGIVLAAAVAGVLAYFLVRRRRQARAG